MRLGEPGAVRPRIEITLSEVQSLPSTLSGGSRRPARLSSGTGLYLLRQHLLHDLVVLDAGQSLVQALVEEAQLLVVQAEQV